MAFQPIVDIDTHSVYAYEALVRGPLGEGSASVLNQVTKQNKYAFDQSCRARAICLATELGIQATGASLSINFIPGAVVNPVTCLRTTLVLADSLNIPLDRLIFEITEHEKVSNPSHILAIATAYRDKGLRIALDDFGAGYSGLRTLADLPIDILKLDIALTRDIDKRPTARVIVSQVVELAHKLGKVLIAEGIETPQEFETLHHCGIRFMQGYLFARPAFEQLPAASMPARQPDRSQSARYHLSLG